MDGRDCEWVSIENMVLKLQYFLLCWDFCHLVFDVFTPPPQPYQSPNHFPCSQEKDPDLLSLLAGPGTATHFPYYMTAVLTVVTFMIKRVIN